MDQQYWLQQQTFPSPYNNLYNNLTTSAMATPSDNVARARGKRGQGARRRPKTSDVEPYIDITNLPQADDYGGQNHWSIQGQTAPWYPNITPPLLPPMPSPPKGPELSLAAISHPQAGYMTASLPVQVYQLMPTPPVTDGPMPQSVAPSHTQINYPTPPTPAQYIGSYGPMLNNPNLAGGQGYASPSPHGPLGTNSVANPGIRGRPQDGRRVVSAPQATAPPQSSPQYLNGLYTPYQFQPNNHISAPAAPSPQPASQASPPIPQVQAPQHSPQIQPTPRLPDGLDSIYEECRRLSREEQERVAAEEAEKEQEKAEQERLAAEREANRFDWSEGDMTAYPAECVEEVELPRSEYRARAIHIGTPLRSGFSDYGGSLRGRLSVYAVRRSHSGVVEFRVAPDGSSPARIRKGPPTAYKHVRLNALFHGMPEAQAERWVRQLLATVPGQNDTIMKWTRDGGGAAGQDAAE